MVCAPPRWYEPNQRSGSITAFAAARPHAGGRLRNDSPHSVADHRFDDIRGARPSTSACRAADGCGRPLVPACCPKRRERPLDRPWRRGGRRHHGVAYDRAERGMCLRESRRIADERGYGSTASSSLARSSRRAGGGHSARGPDGAARVFHWDAAGARAFGG